jgi:hypothetical protein
MSFAAALRRIHRKMQGVTEAEVQAALSETTRTAGPPSATVPEPETRTR